MVTFIARWGFAPTVRVPRMAHLVEVPKLFYRRHPKIGMKIELVIQPRGPGLLRADTKKIRPHHGIGFSRCRIAGRIPFCKQSADVHYRFYLTCCQKSKRVHQHACAGRWGRQGSYRFSPSNRKALCTLSRSSKNEAGFVFEMPLHTSPATAGQKSAGALNASPARCRLVSATSP